MKLLKRQTLKLVLILSVTFALFFSVSVSPFAQIQSKLPAPASHVNDFAGVVDGSTKQRLENVLANLQQRTGINLTVATVQTTGGQDVFDFSRELARDWDIGLRASTDKSLLLVVSVDDKTFFTQLTKRAQSDLPEGALGEMNQRMRPFVSERNVSRALLTGVEKLVGDLAGKLGFSTEDMDQPAAGQPAVSGQSVVATEAAAAEATPKPSREATPKPTEENRQAEAPAKPAEDATASANSPKKSKDLAANSPKTSVATKTETSPADDEAEAEEVELTLTLPVAARVEKLKDFLATHPDSKSTARATELLISARAALGDQRLKAGDNAAGIEQMLIAIADSPPDMSGKLFTGVIAQIPLNLYLRGEQVTAFKAARLIEAKVTNDPKRLVALAGFYLSIERGDEAARLAEQAAKLAPDMAEVHDALGLALHISLRLDEAAAEYKRALELNPKSPGVRRSLADLNRAAGKVEDALALYREQLSAESADKGGRAGLVLSLFELGRTDEANKELQSALKDDPRNLALLTGTAYWFVAHSDSQRALDLAQKAVDV